jgi:hypothetical protein
MRFAQHRHKPAALRPAAIAATYNPVFGEAGAQSFLWRGLNSKHGNSSICGSPWRPRPLASEQTQALADGATSLHGQGRIEKFSLVRRAAR